MNYKSLPFLGMIWLFVIIISLLALPFVRGSENSRFIVAIVVIVGSFLLFGVIYARRAFVMWRHVEYSNEELWRALNTIPVLGEGFRNIPKYIMFLFNKSGETDAVLKDLKSRTREALLYLFFVYASLPLLFLIYMTF